MSKTIYITIKRRGDTITVTTRQRSKSGKPVKVAVCTLKNGPGTLWHDLDNRLLGVGLRVWAHA